jgi:parallel beta-helix repeat protein
MIRILWIAVCAFSIAAAAADLTLYVAPNGNDTWSGKLSAPDSRSGDGPFATLARARACIRALKAGKDLTFPVTVMVRGGKYYLDDTVVFHKEDSGTRACPVTYQAYPGEKPILSGGRKVTGWRPFSGNILTAELPGSKGGKWKFRQLFLDGRRQTRARWPNLDAADPMYGGWAFIEAPAEKRSTIAFRYAPGTFPRRWAKPTEGEVELIQGSGQWRSTVPMKSIDEQTRIIRLTRPGTQFDLVPWYDVVPLVAGGAFRVTNLLEELDQPGEWSHDSEDGRIYFWPPAGKLTAASEVVVPALRCLIDIAGASWLKFTGFTFTETMDGDNYHHEGVEGAGAMYAQANWQFGGDALHMKDAEHCTIERNHFDVVGCNAIYLEGHNYRNLIRANEIGHAGADGICLLGTKPKHPLFNEVSDNYIHHIGVFNKYVAGVFLGMSDGNLIAHNRIEYVPHHAINLSNNPGGRNILEYNLIRHACLEINDTGAINSWMEQPASKDTERVGHIIRYNYIADTFAFRASLGKVAKEKGWSNGIYLDNYTSNSTVYGNVVVRAVNGLQLHAGKNNLIENNVFVDCSTNFAIMDVVSRGSPFWSGMHGFMTGNSISRNIFYQTGAESYLYSLNNAWTDRTLAWCNDNLFFLTVPRDFPLQDTRKVDESEKFTSLEKWRTLGYDTRSIVADPLFMDPAHDDYRLQATSPAFKLGFVSIDIRRIGPRD